MQIGSEEHKRLLCETFIASHNRYEPQDMPWPQLDDVSLARLRAIPIWTMALDIEISAGAMLQGFSKTESDPLVRDALALQGFEEARHGRILAEMIRRYGLTVQTKEPTKDPTRRAFVHFGYDECVDSFAGFGIFKLARDARILPESLTSLFARVLEEEARHIVFFVNWIAWDRARSGLTPPYMQILPSLVSYVAAIVRRVQGGSAMAGGGNNDGSAAMGLFSDVMRDLTPAKFLRACLTENDRYMRSFDRRLLRPRVIPTLGKTALVVMELIDALRALLGRAQARA
ncbi:MAG: ferritin-like domain-containing protein [Candidatus Tumulicola sp.]